MPLCAGIALARTIALVAITLLAGCATAATPRIVTVPSSEASPVSRFDQIDDYRSAAATVAGAVHNELAERPFPVTFRFFPNRKAFETALRDVGYPTELAHDAAATMAAIGGHRRVLLNAAVLAALVWRDRVALLAHELGHTVQYELGGGSRGTSDQWLREGFAEWLSMRVLDRLQAVPAAAFRRQKIDEWRTRNRSAVPRLDEMVTFPQWVALSRRGETTLYSQAFLAVDFLIERHGIPSVVAYFQRFAHSMDRVANFRDTFGEDLPAFETALDARMRKR